MGNASSLRHHIETAERTGVIQLAKTNLRDIPKDLLPICDRLRTLDLSRNRFQKLNDNIGLFINLKVLNLSINKIQTISPAIAKLAKLETLQLDGNLLTELPSDIKDLTSLKTLNLSQNNFTRFPSQVCQLPNLEVLDLSINSIVHIPDEIKNCTAIEINLNSNRLTSLSEGLTLCPRLKVFRSDNNSIELSSITRPILADSKICLLSVENNPFTMKQLQSRDGYEEYSERYTSTKRKMF